MCSKMVVTVIIMDECPGGIYSSFGKNHFDLSVTTFTDMASPRASSDLLNTGFDSVFFISNYLLLHLNQVNQRIFAEMMSL